MSITVEQLTQFFPSETGYYLKSDTANFQEYPHVIWAMIFAATEDQYAGHIRIYSVLDQETGDLYQIVKLDENIALQGFTLIHNNVVEGE